MRDALKELLRLVVEDVITTGEPVGSLALVEEHDLDISPATIRNWFAILEDEGYLMQPHTSSGRVPTEKGYRLYISELMAERTLRQRERKELQESSNDVRQLAKIMADLAEDAVILARDAQSFATGLSHLFAQPEFRDWNHMRTLGETLDRLDDLVESVRRREFKEPTALIGSDCPFGEVCGTVLLTLNDGTLLGVLGPIRMNYPQGFALLRTAKEFMNDDE
ncbi:hypothetical protein HY479_02575 [Candidatus Uhrbacteria bacterium]|nr:hypothetical protein [Candidatus Uhrbacteria bacterium]